MKALGDDAEAVLWVGGEGGMEAEMINRQNIPFTTIQAAGIHGVSLGTLPGNILHLVKGIFKSRRILADFRPDALLFTGGFVAVPMALAGWSYESLLYVPDIEPGLAIKTIARLSDRIAVTVEASKSFFKYTKKVDVTGYPTRPDLDGWNLESARTFFKLHTRKPVLLVFGGSKGAQSINLAIFENLESILDIAQVIHITGQSNFDQACLSAEQLTRNSDDYHPFSYLHEEMGAAFTVSDLAVCRAGASTLGELPLFGLPAILVPYPYAWRYQKVNADYLIENRGAVLVKNEELSSKLLSTISSLLKSPETLTRMSDHMKAISTPQAAQKLADVLRQLVKEPSID